MDELAEFGQRLTQLTDNDAVKRMTAKAGAAGKKSALDAAARDLGGDRRFSGMRRKTALGAGYDSVGASSVEIKFRPAGLWNLAEQGRRGTKPIRPRKRGGRRALLTPAGPRAASTSKPSRGLGTLKDAMRDAQREVPKAAAKQFTQEVRKVVH